MLAKFKVAGFKSFSQETLLDVCSTNYKMLENKNTSNGILKGLMFIGGNATGKTNVIYSITILLDLLFKDAILSIPMNACMFSKEPIRLEYSFVFDKDEIVYYIEIAKTGEIREEQLYLNGAEIMRRIGLNATSKITERATYDNSSINATTLFLKTIYFNTQFANYPVLAKWFKYMSNSIYFNADKKMVIPYDINNKINLLSYLEKYGTDKINAFFKYFGFNQEVVFDTRHQLTPYVKAESNNVKNIFMKRNDIDYWMPYVLESVGNQTLLEMLPSLLFAAENPCMFIIDEFSSAFHNELEELIVRYFMENSNNSQMFFVSHSTNLIKTSLLRPDQIYTVEFKDARGSIVKRVSSEHPRESQNLEKMYLSGVFGGLPNYATENN